MGAECDIESDVVRTVCFSGHRELTPPAQRSLFEGGIDTHEGFREALACRVRKLCKRLYAEGARHFICGMAEGFDLLAGEIVARLKKELPGIRLTAAVPFPQQPRSYPAEEKERYDAVTAASDEVVFVCGSYSPDCFHRRNDHMVERSGALICWFDGRPGGTAYTVRQAVKKGLDVYNIIFEI